MDGITMVISTIKASLAKAKFVSPDIKPALETLLDSHKTDLGDVGYEASVDTEANVKALNAILDELDTTAEDTREDLKEAGALRREQDEEEDPR